VHDVVIRGGTVVDGSGSAPSTADVAIDGGRIAAVGTDVGDARRVLDADGLLVTPGFVDVHTHYDGQALWDPLLAPSCLHGVTTVVMGNCGVGFAPVRPAEHRRLIELMEGVEDIPADVLETGIPWGWESFPEYLDALAAHPHAVNIGAMMTHAALRLFVMGERALDHSSPSDDDLTSMRALVAEGIAAGALGVSTSRSPTHKTKAGVLIPCAWAPDDELFALAGGLADAGVGVFEAAAVALPVVFEMAARSSRPVFVGLAQRDDTPDAWRDDLAAIIAASDRGATVMAQVPSRAVGAVLGLEGTYHPFRACPSYVTMAPLPLAERIARMRTEEVRNAILREASDNPPRYDLTRTWVLSDPPQYEPLASESIASVAASHHRQPLDFAYDLLTAGDGTTKLYCASNCYATYDFSFVEEVLQSPHTVPGLGDGGAHCTVISDASFPTTLLAHWGRDRTRGPRFPIEWLVKRQTHDTAQAYGLYDRGLLQPGLRADLNVIDFDHLGVGVPSMVYDFPAGGGRLVQPASGYVMTIVSGEVTFENGEHTGSYPGTVVGRSGA
jgi:N-acyl-D-aspartate/D-glutamate deacylase